MTGKLLNDFISAASSCAHEMLASAAYIESELLSLVIPDAHRSAIKQVCSDLAGTKHDVVSDLGELHELTVPAGSTVVQNRVERIRNWLADELPKLHAVVKSLESASAFDNKVELAYMLVAESSVNVLRSFENVTQAARKYREAV